MSGNLSRMGLKPFYGKKEKKRADDAMEKLDITGLAKKNSQVSRKTGKVQGSTLQTFRQTGFTFFR